MSHITPHALDSPAIFLRILEYVPISDMQALRLCSVKLNCSVKTFLSNLLHRLLSQYVTGPDDFREQLRATQSVICGSEALNFVLHATALPTIQSADLDLITSPVHAITLVRYLKVVEGYHVLPLGRPARIDRIADFRPGVISITRLIHPKKGRIDIACSTRLNSTHPLVYCPHTLLFNYLTADGLLVAYPEWTLGGSGVKSNMLWHSPSALGYQAKVEGWGWTSVPQIHSPVSSLSL